MTSVQANLYPKIAEFYDTATELWERTWGEHLHHGYYGPRGEEKKDPYQAQVDLIQVLLDWGEVTPDPLIQRVLDVGCGVGGSALYLAQGLGVQVQGVTLSGVQARRAMDRAQAMGLDTQVHVQVADALHLPFGEGTFDLVWSLESGEHMPNKHQFLRECYRVLRPQGRFICATWCHRPTTVAPLNDTEKHHLHAIYQLYHLPFVLSLPDYEAIARSVGFRAVATADWSGAVAPFWDAVIASALNPVTLLGVLQAGLPTIRGAAALGLMRQGYERGLIRYGVLRGLK